MKVIKTKKPSGGWKIFSKNYFLVLILTFFVAGFFFLALPDNSFAQPFGCCTESGGSGSCQPGESWPKPNASQANCEALPNPGGKQWLPNDICTGGPPMCVPGTGCCAMPNTQFPSAFICTDNQTPGQCDGVDDQFFLDTDCNDVDICTPPTGCCEITGGDMCIGSLTEQQCLEGQSGLSWDEGAPCTTGEGCGDPEGCCPNDGTNPTACSIATQTECGDVTIQPGLLCNDEFTCGPLGCCQDTDPTECSVDIRAECPDGNWIEGDTCTDSGICASLVSGCCELSPTTCEEQTAPIDCEPRFFFENEACIDGVSCGELPPNGCCQNEINPPSCENVNQANCPTEDFFIGNECMDTGFCEPLGCCFLEAANGQALANRQINPEKCVETTGTICGEIGGEFAGPDTSCSEFPLICEDPKVNILIPTLNQWGLIAMAGLLGIFSLFIIMRRHRYNVS
jgi:hypothetical protein